MVRRIKEIDAEGLFDKNIQCIKDGLFPHSIFQFFTVVCAAEMAVRVERAATFFGADLSISPKDILITISCGYVQDVMDPLDDKKKIGTRTEKIIFCVKQFLLDYITDDNKGKLCERDDIRYLVSFKRLKGSFKAYSKIVRKYLEFYEVAEAMELDE
eukprot:UN05703